MKKKVLFTKIKAKLGLEDMGDKENHEDLKTFIKETMEGMSKIFMQGLEFFAIQLMGKSTFGSGSSSAHEERKNHGEAIFSKNRPHNRPHEFINKNGPTIPKFLESK